MSEYRPKAGDRVRVVLEGEVTYHSEATGDFKVGINDWITNGGEHVVSVEKIEPPVIVFKPGDVVRSKVDGGVLTLAERGFISHRTGKFNDLNPIITSEYYEKVNLG